MCDAARESLRQYRWREPLHGVLYKVLMSIPSRSMSVLRDQLPARLTRAGFPDMDWADFFEPHSLTKSEAERLMRDLCELSK